MAQYESEKSQESSFLQRPELRPVVPEMSKKFGDPILFKFYKYRENEIPDARLPQGITNLEYVIAQGENDLSARLPLSASAAPEDRAFLFIRLFVEDFFGSGSEGAGVPGIQVFQKHMMQSRLGTHCIFGLRRQGFEIEEHSFVVHVDQSGRVVMLCCTYLPDLPALFQEPSAFPEKSVREQLEGIRYDVAEAERQWLVIWPTEGENKRPSVTPGSQVKLSLDSSLNQPNTVGVTADGIKKRYRSSPGAYDKSIGLGKILRSYFIEEDEPQEIERLGDDIIKSQQHLHLAVLRNLESNSKLVGRYAAVQDEIDSTSENRRGIFTNESASGIDRVNAYYHLDYIQRYFRENLDFQVLDAYPHLNPVSVVLKYAPSPKLAEYDVIRQEMYFFQIGSTQTTAARDARFVYHEFLHTVSDAIARLSRGGGISVTGRSQETLQSQAMDEGTADYFACSLASQQGAKKARFYSISRRRWRKARDLNPEHPGRFEIAQVRGVTEETWGGVKYLLGEQWARHLWSLRVQLGPEVADLLIAHSLFFLTRWSSFRQGIQALRLADRLLFPEEHTKEISEFENQITLVLDERPLPEKEVAAR